MKAARLIEGDVGRVSGPSEVEDALEGAGCFVRSEIADPELQRLITAAISGLQSQLQAEDKVLLPFVHLPLAVYNAIRGDAAPAQPLSVATTLLFLGIDILDDIADRDLPPYWQGHSEAEIQLAAATLLASLPQLAISRLNIAPSNKARMLACLSEGLLHMSAGQLYDLRGAGKEMVSPEDVEKSVEKKSGEEGALIAMLAAHMAGASPETAHSYGEFGRALATGGQIATDCHDIFQAAHSKDLANGTRSLPIALHLSRLQGADRKIFLSQLHEARDSTAVQERIRKELRAKGVLRLCAFVVEMYCQRACNALAKLQLSGGALTMLQQMVDHVSFYSHKGDV